MNKLHALICLPFLLAISLSFAQDEASWLGKYSAKVWTSGKSDTLNYTVRPPDKIESGQKYPLVFLLHGAGGRGDDNRGQIVDEGGGEALEKMGISGDYGAFVMAGQVPLVKSGVSDGRAQRD